MTELQPTTSFNLFISVGEESADLHASLLCKHLRERQPDIKLFGFGGAKMEAEGVEILYPLPDLALIGFVEVAKHLPLMFKLKRQALKCWDRRKPDAVLLVDYPGFNFRLAAEAHKRGIPVLYYIAPQAWAWKERRVETMRERFAHLFAIFPFEEPFFSQRGVPTTYVGHPLIERIPPVEPGKVCQGIPDHPVIGLMPGSRKNELRHILPTLVEAAKMLRDKQKHDQLQNIKFVLPLADTLSESFLDKFNIPNWIEIFRDTGYKRRREITFAWTASGTATIENALLGIPMAVVYKTGSLNIFLGRRFVRIPYIGMVNLIAQKGICPEFIQEQCNPISLVRFTQEFLLSPERYHDMKNDLLCVRKKMGTEPASQRTADAILRYLQQSKIAAKENANDH